MHVVAPTEASTCRSKDSKGCIERPCDYVIACISFEREISQMKLVATLKQVDKKKEKEENGEGRIRNEIAQKEIEGQQKWMRAPEVAKWQQKHRVDWDATDGRNGGAQRPVGEIMLEMERFKYQAGGKYQGAVALILDLAKAYERVGLPVVWAWATHFTFPRKMLRVPCGYFEHQRRVQFEGCVAEPLRTIMAILAGSRWSCLLLRIVLQDALSEATKICLPLKLRVLVDDLTALLTAQIIKTIAFLPNS